MCLSPQMSRFPPHPGVGCSDLYRGVCLCVGYSLHLSHPPPCHQSQAKLAAVAGPSPSSGAAAMRAPPPRLPGGATPATETPAPAAQVPQPMERPTPADAEEEAAGPRVGEHVAGWASVFAADADTIAVRSHHHPGSASFVSLRQHQLSTSSQARSAM